jgi:hypothetical protein
VKATGGPVYLLPKGVPMNMKRTDDDAGLALVAALSKLITTDWDGLWWPWSSDEG